MKEFSNKKHSIYERDRIRRMKAENPEKYKERLNQIKNRFHSLSKDQKERIKPRLKLASRKYRLNNPLSVERKEQLCQYAKEYRNKNSEKIFIKRKLKNKINSEKRRNRYWSNEEYRERVKAQGRLRNFNRKNDPAYKLRRSLCSKKQKERPIVRLKLNLRRRLVLALKGASKSARTMDLIGCSVEQLQRHMENQFKVGMSWGNYGAKGWSMDHIIPCSKFNLFLEEEQRKCFHYSNLQPLWVSENSSKKDQINDGDVAPEFKIVEEQQQLGVIENER